MGTCCFEVISVQIQIGFIEMAQFIKLSHVILLVIYNFFVPNGICRKRPAEQSHGMDISES